MGFQYRVSNSETGVASETWKPIDTLNPANLAVLGIGNHSLSGVAASDNGLMEYRIQLYTEEVQDWVIPNLDALRWGAEEGVVFLEQSFCHSAQCPQITFSTYHAAWSKNLHNQPCLNLQ